MPPDSTATKARLLDAAHAEFVQHGIAGARVDRIAENAKANKRLIYVYFGNKDELFDIVLARSTAAISDLVPYTPDDLPGYAVRLFDALVKDPSMLRLNHWRQLERPVSPQQRVDSLAYKLGAIEQAQRDGRVRREIAPVDLILLVVGMSMAWFTTTGSYHGHTEDAADIARHRAAIEIAVRRLVQP